MRKEEQPVLSDFIEKDQFELNSYLTSLFETTSEKEEKTVDKLRVYRATFHAESSFFIL
ncbi:hypothetical protein F6Y04_08055 [Bacillus megaterium]|nr:hypothetical protein [Priestia megaterium]